MKAVLDRLAGHSLALHIEAPARTEDDDAQ
jgi:hypothetical protein